MATRYCSVIDVQHVAKVFSQDYDRIDPVIESQIEEAIDEASDIARHLMINRYDITPFDTTVPEVLKSFTKVMGAKIVLSQFGQVTTGKVDEVLERLSKRTKFYKAIIIDGGMLNTDGILITADTFSETINTSPLVAIDNAFEDGPRGY